MSDPSETSPYHAPTPSSAPRFTSGELLANRYRIVAPLGKGGMGEVYRADDLTLGQPVALKFLPSHLSNDPDRLARFRKEVASARRVSHPNVCRVYDIVEHDGQSFLAMEFVDGEDLASVLRRLGRVPEEKGVEVARQLCSALAAVHEQGLLHRDLKPANVMLDGRGKVRLTDFGLAAAEEDLSATDVRSGTPLYQSPEQITGKEVTVRSDLYALGLVLYELFTGKCAFTGKDRSTPPSKPSTHISTLNPPVEQIILRCLEADPSRRPQSAMDVLMALPGGDPLAAALAAGVVPSPAMVAHAGEIGIIRPWVGTAFFGGLLLALCLYAVLYPETMAFAKVGGLPKSTEWLSGKARDVRDLAGYPDQNSAAGYDFDQQLAEWIENTDQSPRRWDRLTQPSAAPLAFWYRDSPKPLVPGLFYAYTGSIETTRVTWSDPQPTLPGMTGVRLAPDGRLLEFYAVPSDQTAPAGNAPDWKVWFDKAQLKLDDFHSETNHPWVPPVFADQSYTWVVNDPQNTVLAHRVEAATHRNRLVWFRITPIWQLPNESSVNRDAGESGEQIQGIGDQGSAMGSPMVYIGLVIGVIVLAPFTLRAGRADRRGAFLLGAMVFVIMMLVWVAETRHVFRFDEVQLFVYGLASASYWAALVGFTYLVLEPFVRRWWPQTVISWNRLLIGRWRDPLVGRDILVGILAGVLWTLCSQLANQSPKWVGGPAPNLLWDWWVPNSQVSGFWTGNFLINFAYSFRFAFFYCLLLLILLRVVFRKPWLAGVAFVVITACSVAYDLHYRSPSVGWLFIALGQIVYLLTLVRFGALAMFMASFAMNTLWFPMTTDPSRDYFGSGLLALGSVVGLAAFGLLTATGGQRLFKKGFFGDE